MNNKKRLFERPTLLSFVFLFFIISTVFLTIGYSAYGSTLAIDGSLIARSSLDVRITDIKLNSSGSQLATQTVTPGYTTTSIDGGVRLTSASSYVTYDVTITNLSSQNVLVTDIASTQWTNNNMEYVLENLTLNETIIPSASEYTFQLKIKFKDETISKINGLIETTIENVLGISLNLNMILDFTFYKIPQYSLEITSIPTDAIITYTVNDEVVATCTGYCRKVFDNNINVTWKVQKDGAPIETDTITMDKDYSKTVDLSRYFSNVKYSTMTVSCANYTKGSSPYTVEYSGNCEVIEDSNDNWRIKFLTSGDLTFAYDIDTDIFVVGGGGGNAGGGGYASTYIDQSLSKNTTYSINVGNGGTNTSSGEQSYIKLDDNIQYYADGGEVGQEKTGSIGGSGGGYYYVNYECTARWDQAGCVAWGYVTHDAPGASYGNDGKGTGQYNTEGKPWSNQTTCEFDEGTLNGCTLGDDYAYSGGGSGTSTASAGGGGAKGEDGTPNTGGGGGYNAAGGSGVVIIRNVEANEIKIGNTYIGNYSGNFDIEGDENNWKIKFTSSGKLKLYNNINTDIFVVGGGGGNAGGGGYASTYLEQSLSENIAYSIYIGKGGTNTSGGEQSYIKSKDNIQYYADGGEAGQEKTGSIGGSGGGYYYLNYECTERWDQAGCVAWGYVAKTAPGASYGNDGKGTGQYNTEGKPWSGQTTCEFNEGTLNGCTLGDDYAYSGGGSGTSTASAGGGGAKEEDGTPNTGGGGGYNAAGGSGIVVIRNIKNTFTIDPQPSSAAVYLKCGNTEISGFGTQSCETGDNTTIEYSVTKAGYYDKSGSYTLEKGDYTLEISLEEKPWITGTYTNTDYSFAATETLEVHHSGKYLIDIWGGSGADKYSVDLTSSGYGGAGGHVYGVVELYEGQTVYYTLGGNAQTSVLGGLFGGNILKSESGVNGGGIANSDSLGAGGGYSAFAVGTTLISEETINSGNVLFIAAGGGGGGGSDSSKSDTFACGNGGSGGNMTSTKIAISTIGYAFQGEDGTVPSDGDETYIGGGGSDTAGICSSKSKNNGSLLNGGESYEKGGAGGSGYYGGAGGRGDGKDKSGKYSAGGGGGSSFVSSLATFENLDSTITSKLTTTNPSTTGGSIIITYIGS